MIYFNRFLLGEKGTLFLYEDHAFLVNSVDVWL